MKRLSNADKQTLQGVITSYSIHYTKLYENNIENFKHYKNVYQSLDIDYAIVHSTDGYDEISLTADTKFASKKTDCFFTHNDFGMDKIDSTKLYGGDTVEDAAKIFMNILTGKGTKEQTNVVIANAVITSYSIHYTKLYDTLF